LQCVSALQCPVGAGDILCIRIGDTFLAIDNGSDLDGGGSVVDRRSAIGKRTRFRCVIGGFDNAWNPDLRV